MDLGIAGRRALVFGSTSGIGRGIAAVLVSEGARVVVSGRRSPRLAKAAAELGAAGSVAADLDVPGAGAAALEAAREILGGVDILVTNCGGPSKSEFQQTANRDWQAATQQVLYGATDAIAAALPEMIANGWGRIVVVTSSTGREPLSGLTLSNVLRPALHGLVNSLSKEVAAAGVTVNALMPGMTDTPRIAELGLPSTELAKSIPAARLAEPMEIGYLAAFLASDRAAYITGQAVACDGGRLAGI